MPLYHLQQWHRIYHHITTIRDRRDNTSMCLRFLFSKLMLTSSSHDVMWKRSLLLKLFDLLKPKYAINNPYIIQLALFYVIRVNNCWEEMTQMGFIQNRMVGALPDRHMAAVTDPVMNLSTGALYRYVTTFSFSFPLYKLLLKPVSQVWDLFHESVNYLYDNLLSLLTLSSGAVYTQKHQIWHRAFSGKSHVLFGQMSTSYMSKHSRLLYTLLDFGMFCTKPNCCEPWLFPRTHPLSEERTLCFNQLVVLIQAARNNPLTLQQRCRIVIRQSMTDVRILADCYTFTIPVILQDYLSFRSLNAKIRPWLLNRAESRVFYDPLDSLCDRYGIEIQQ